MDPAQRVGGEFQSTKDAILRGKQGLLDAMI